MYIFKFIIYWLRQGFIAVCGLFLAAASRGYSLVAKLGGLGSWAEYVAQGLSCALARGNFPDQVLNLSPLHWQAES